MLTIINENQILDYIKCSAFYDMKYNKNIDISDPNNITRQLHNLSRFFFIQIFNNKAPNLKTLKDKFDSLLKTLDDISSKQVLESMQMISNLYDWTLKNNIKVADINSLYSFIINGVDIQGYTGITIDINGKYYLLVIDFRKKHINVELANLDLKTTLHAYAFYKLYNTPISGVLIYNAKYNEEALLYKDTDDYKRLQNCLINITNGIKHNIYIPNSNIYCEKCLTQPLCRYWNS